MCAIKTNKRRAFSLIELVIVVVIIGIIGAIAIPRMSRGASGASDSALVASLSVLRNAIDLYEAEHGAFPAVATFADQMTKYSDYAGATQATKDTTYRYGPYLRAIPPLSIGAEKGSNGVAAAAGGGIAWIYNETTGVISANTAALTDEAGKLYTTY